MLHMSVPKRAQVAVSSAQATMKSSPELKPDTQLQDAFITCQVSKDDSVKAQQPIAPAFIKPAASEGRPVLNLKPRTLPLQGASVDPVAEMPTSDEPSRERPKLNLKPRSKPTQPAAPAPPAERKPSVFGDALPREMVLTNRGEPDRSANLERTISAPVAAKPRNEGWQSVQGNRKKAASFRSGDQRRSSINAPPRMNDDPFFSDYVPPGRSFSAFVGDYDTMEPIRDVSHAEDTTVMSKRALPIRCDDFF
eukprot:scaffold563181_cov49-Prasinocladus_malaysianus.AAC.1